MFYPNDPLFSFKVRCVSTELKFSLLPRRCYISDKSLWMKESYMQTACWSFRQGDDIERRWYDKETFLIERLKGEL